MHHRRLIKVNGIVQGVGFRPFVYNLALKHNLTGFVSNTSAGVHIEIEGSPTAINNFSTELRSDPPPLSVIADIKEISILIQNDANFIIKPSDGNESVSTLISPDMAVCDDCVKELFDPKDRRYRYPFINCTNCGPRYTIIDNIPYDRPFTSMRHFKLCPDCQSEYDDPTDRRFHAQPNACPVCGPQVTLTLKDGNIVETDDPIVETIIALKKGNVVAIKGLGGFHLAVDANNENAVKTLRQRKGREEKPLAVMVRDLQTAERLCEISEDERKLLTSQQSPIVLLKKHANYTLAESVAPNNDRLGVMLPYTPVHHLLLDAELKMLVMTSANFCEEPICIDIDEAEKRLNAIADYFLNHNRDIYLRSDDSVMIHLAGDPRPIRRSRGFAPQPIFVQSDGPPILSVGGELKNTICLLKEDRAFLSQHIGDLENLEAYEFFKMTIHHLERIFETTPELIVHDMHPGYLSTQWAKEQNDIPLLAVQHHHAHIASCMAEHDLDEPVIGIALDGTGYGTDNTIWGGEVLIADFAEFQRFAYLEPLPLPGGDAAIKAPWRTAVSYLLHAFDGELPELQFLENHDVSTVVEMVKKNINSPLTTSCGRLFDAVTAMCGGRQTIRYEGQAAIEFMQSAGNAVHRPYDYIFDRNDDSWIIRIAPMIRSIVWSLRKGEDMSHISAGFHLTLAALFTEITELARDQTGIKKVVLSGGVFQNQRLFEEIIPRLESKGLQVYTHSQVPTNDGGISLGQTLIGRKFLSSMS